MSATQNDSPSVRDVLDALDEEIDAHRRVFEDHHPTLATLLLAKQALEAHEGFAAISGLQDPEATRCVHCAKPVRQAEQGESEGLPAGTWVHKEPLDGKRRCTQLGVNPAIVDTWLPNATPYTTDTETIKEAASMALTLADTFGASHTRASGAERVETIRRVLRDGFAGKPPEEWDIPEWDARFKHAPTFLRTDIETAIKDFLDAQPPANWVALKFLAEFDAPGTAGAMTAHERDEAASMFARLVTERKVAQGVGPSDAWGAGDQGMPPFVDPESVYHRTFTLGPDSYVEQAGIVKRYVLWGEEVPEKVFDVVSGILTKLRQDASADALHLRNALEPFANQGMVNVSRRLANTLTKLGGATDRDPV